MTNTENTQTSRVDLTPGTAYVFINGRRRGWVAKDSRMSNSSPRGGAFVTGWIARTNAGTLRYATFFGIFDTRKAAVEALLAHYATPTNADRLEGVAIADAIAANA